jgi:hypothetical protein
LRRKSDIAIFRSLLTCEKMKKKIQQELQIIL